MKEVPTKIIKGKSKNPKIIFAGVIIFIFIIFFITINLLGHTFGIPSCSASLKTEDIEYKLETYKTSYSHGEPIEIRLRVKNQSGKDIELSFSTEKQSEFIIEKEHNFLFFFPKLLIWKSSFGKTYKENPTKIVVGANQEKIYSAVWNQVDAVGKEVEPGRYIITGILMEKEKQKPLQIKIEYK